MNYCQSIGNSKDHYFATDPQYTEEYLEIFETAVTVSADAMAKGMRPSDMANYEMPLFGKKKGE